MRMRSLCVTMLVVSTAAITVARASRRNRNTTITARMAPSYSVLIAEW